MTIQVKGEGGSGLNTRFIHKESGQDLTKLLSIAYDAKLTIGHEVTLQAELLVAEPDIEARHAEWQTKHPVTGKFAPLAAFEFRDGTRVEFAEDGTPSVKPTQGGA